MLEVLCIWAIIYIVHTTSYRSGKHAGRIEERNK